MDVHYWASHAQDFLDLLDYPETCPRTEDRLFHTHGRAHKHIGSHVDAVIELNAKQHLANMLHTCMPRKQDMEKLDQLNAKLTALQPGLSSSGA